MKINDAFLPQNIRSHFFLSDLSSHRLFFILHPIRLRKPHFVPFLLLFLGATEARFSVKSYAEMPSSALFELGRCDIIVSSDASSQPLY